MTCVIAGTAHSVQPRDRDPQALKDFPLRSFIYHLPLTPLLRALSGQLMVPVSCPSFPQRAACDFAPTPGCTLSQGGCPGAPPSPPFLRLKYSPSSASSLGWKQTPALGCSKPPPLLPTSPWSRDPSAWGHGAGCGPSSALGPTLQEGASAGKQTPSFPWCKRPWMWPPQPLPLPRSRGGPAGTDAGDSLVASWAPFLPGCAGRASALTENGAGGTDSTLSSAPNPRSTRGGLGDVCVPPVMPKGKGTCRAAAFFFPGKTGTEVMSAPAGRAARASPPRIAAAN